MRRSLVLLAALAVTIAMALPATGAPTLAVDGDDDQVTGQTLVRHDGGSDAAILECNDDATEPAAADPVDGDADPNDGGSARQGNEPFSVVDPTDPELVVAGWNDYCLTDFAAGWQGFAYSVDAGETWTDSLVPGYPQDTSEEGMESPLFGNQRFAGDPIAAFDNEGNLFVGGIAFNRVGAINGSVYVATYGTEPHASGYPVDYLRTRVVGTGTPSRNFVGIFQDKPMLEVDRTGGDHDGNVYVCWSRFPGFGANKIFFSRSIDEGDTFSSPVAISGSPGQGFVQGCDIAVEADGDVYVTWRTDAGPSAVATAGIAFARSTDGGASFSDPEQAVELTPYSPFDGARDCGDGAFECPEGFVFARIPLEPRVTADQSGELEGVYLVYNAIDPESMVESETSYSSAGPGQVGQSLVYVAGSIDDGATWESVAVDAQAEGHQFFPDGDAFGGMLAVVWQDSRTDPCYSVQLPMGNDPDATACGPDDDETEIVNTFVAASDDGTTFGDSAKVSDVGHQPQYEMFADRQIPFQGDYNWISLVSDDVGGLFGYLMWTDNRDVVTGEDPREETQDGFDVHQCREELPDGSFGPDTCPNAGGLDQNIYGNSFDLSTGP
jgi:hypothetical protein